MDSHLEMAYEDANGGLVSTAPEEADYEDMAYSEREWRYPECDDLYDPYDE